MLSYAHAHPLGSVELGEGFSRVPTIPDPTPLTVFSSGRVPTVQRLVARKSIFLHFSQRYPSSPSPASTTFMFFGCGWWYDREIVLPGLLIRLGDGLFVGFLELVLVELTGNWPYDFVNSTPEMTQQKIPAVGGLHGRYFRWPLFPLTSRISYLQRYVRHSKGYVRKAIAIQSRR